MGIILGLNKDVVKRVVKDIGLQTLVDGNPREMVEDIDAVFICNPERIVNTLSSNRLTETIEELPPVEIDPEE